MLKYFTIPIFALIISYAAAAQLRNIDSLKKALPYLHDTARIDCLNEIAFYYTSVQNRDLFEYYLTLAYSESKSLNYIHGIALSLAQKASFQMHYGNDTDAEKLATESLQWYRLTNNKKYIEIPFCQMGREFFSQSKWNEAIINLKQCFYWAKKANNYDGMLGTISLMGEVYREASKYDSSFDLFKQELQLAEQFKDSSRIEGALCNIGDLYQAIEDYPTALKYYAEGFQMVKAKDLSIWDYTTHAELFSLTHEYDSALHYYNLIDTTKLDSKTLPIFLTSKGEYFLLRKQYESAINYLLKGLSYDKQINSVNQIKRVLLDIGEAYYGEEKNNAALDYGRQGLSMALQTNSKQYIRNAYKILYSVYERLHKTDSAYFYYQQYIVMKDSVLSDQIKGKFVAYHYEQKIAILNNEERLQEQQLKQSTQQKVFLIIGLTGILLLGFIGLRNTLLKRKNEKNRREMAENELQLQKVESQHHLSALEMQVLRSQMNPHFIFNSLNSINRFILQNERTQASEYLTKFSKLVRLILQNSQSALIPLDSELESLNLYLNLEALRFNYHFDYKISVSEELDVSALQVPPLILQPYTENAIWHGLMHKEERGHLSIKVAEENNQLCVKISDDGIGRKQAAAFTGKSVPSHKSLGLHITEKRVAMMQKMDALQTPVTINDLINADGSAAGTEVIIKLPVLYD